MGGSTKGPFPVGSGSRPLNHRYLRKGLYDCKKTAFDSYRNLDRREVCTNNNKSVLLIVLLYCYSSTMPGYPFKDVKTTRKQGTGHTVQQGTGHTVQDESWKIVMR